MHRDERGFTLLELMVVVAIVAILAAVVIPSFMSSARKGKGKSEVSAMLAELATKEEAYKTENGAYLTAAKCPATAPKADYDFNTTCETTGSAWATLRVIPTEKNLRCSYQIVPHLATDVPSSAGVSLSACANCAFTSTNQAAQSYFVMLAECDLDGQGGTNTTYQTSSLDTTICPCNEGN